MINQKQSIYIRITKTGSSSMSKWIISNGFPTLIFSVRSKNFELQRSKFKNIKNLDDFFTFTLCRNPFARAVSSWRFFLTSNRLSTDSCQLISFADFLKNKPENTYWHQHKRPQHDFVLNFENFFETNIYSIQKLENLNKALTTLSDMYPKESYALFPKIRVSNTRPYQEFYNDETKDLVLKMFEKDFEYFNYSTEL